jgi:leader peptidase (prepilin peptidase) / N-methyltransferase
MPLEAALLGLLGAVLGSFAATVAVRWPDGRTVLGRSACDGCGRELRSWELVPLLSWAVARGRCRRCGAAIDPLHPIVEAGAVLVGVSAGLVASGPAAWAGAVFGWLLLTLAALDARALWLPDAIVAPLALGGLATGVGGLAPALDERLIGGLAGFGGLWLVARGYRLLRGRDGMGGGDPKLLGAIGLWIGWRLLPAVLLVAGLFGLGVVLVAALVRRPLAGDHPLPLGTLMAVAAYPAWCFLIGQGA